MRKDSFWREYREAAMTLNNAPGETSEVEWGKVVEAADRLSRKTWATPVRSQEDLRLLAQIAAYWNEGGYNERGDFIVSGIDSECFGERSIAELISAVLALCDPNHERDTSS